MNTSRWTVAASLALLTFSLHAHNSVVVIPLGEDEIIPPSFEKEGNSAVGSANPTFEVVQSSFISARINVEGDADFYQVYVPVGFTLTAEIVGDRGDECGNVGIIDSELSLFDVDGTTQLDFNDDIGFGNWCSSVNFTALNSGVYFVRAAASALFCEGCIFNYGLSLKVENTPTFSDVRLKENIQPLGKTRSGFQLYKFSYIGDVASRSLVGVMAQDLLRSHPDAVLKDSTGYYRVDYASLGLKMTTWDRWLKDGEQATLLAP